ncbi:MAG TPA: hypothetical protein VKZ60_19265 [Chloroflexota bacterium]|jgi:hypothetical protein|nr:hypothetical protein [Chloroflexota bacterium]
MDRETVRGLKEELERFGPDATYVIMQDDRALVLLPEGERHIVAREVLTDGTAHEIAARDALDLLREWIEQHRLG